MKRSLKFYKGEINLMSKLYELTGEYIQLLDMLEDEEYDERAILDTIEGIDYEIEIKADNYAKIIKSLESDIEAIKAEKTRLDNRQKVYENRIKWLKKNLEMAMRATRKMKFSTELFSFGIRKAGGKRTLVIDKDITDVPKEFRIAQPDKIDGEKLRDYIEENGYTTDDGSIYCDFAHFEPQGEYLNIR